MNVGIVGSEAAKFTKSGEEEVKKLIANLIRPYNKVISGGCHLGGIDIWAIEEAKLQGKEYHEYLPKSLSWPDYKARNILIAEYSDVVVCFTVKQLPQGYRKKGFEDYCYHCKTNEHVKSGGCWTVKYARTLGKPTYIIVVKNEE